MNLSFIDFAIILGFFLLYILVGFWAGRKSGKDAADYFLSGRNMPWWLLGISMVATTFSADTPNLVTDIVRQNGVSGNWAWWAFLLTGMLTVFVYARLWRRLGTVTDLEFYELRYGGKAAAGLRAFRAIYLGVFFNVVVMATVCVAGVKIAGILLGIEPWKTLLIAGVITVLYSAVGGLRGVILTDFVQFIVAMTGSVAATWYILEMPEIGGLSQLIGHTSVSPKLNLLPSFDNPEEYVPLLVIPLAVQWWSVWYPGAEPGGGGYIAQRMLSAKNEKSAMAATLFFNVAHYALRPWPWILVALASLIVFPSIESIQTAFPGIPEGKLGNDLAYPAMLSFLPSGLKGLVLASLIAAFLSTLSTHLNWGASYVVNDFYLRFIKPSASSKEQVQVGRFTTVLLMILAGALSFAIESAKEGFGLLLQIGAGTGLIFILRWFWFRINAWTEISGMVISFVVAIGLKLITKYSSLDLAGHEEMLLGVGITTVGWLTVTLLTSPEGNDVLKKFYLIARPSGKSWHRFLEEGELPPTETGSLPLQITAMVAGCTSVYCALFSTGNFIYGHFGLGLTLAICSVLSALYIFLIRKSIS